MKNRFKKVLSVLIVIALLVSSIMMVFAEEEAVETPATETVVESAPAAEEAPVQEEAPAAVEAPVQEEAPAAAEAPAQEEATAAAEAPVQEEAPAATEAPAQEETAAPAETAAEEASNNEAATVETEAPVEEAPAQAEEAAQEEPTPAAEEAVQENNNIVEETPAAEETAENPAADEETTDAEEIPAEETAENNSSEEEVNEDAGEEEAAEASDAAEADTEEGTDAEEAVAEETAETSDAEDAVDGEETAESETPAEEANNNEETASEENVDELANEPAVINEEDMQEMDDDAGYIDPEVVAQHIPEVTPEMKYDNITELKIGSQVSGTVYADAAALYYIKSSRNQTVVLGLYTNDNIQVRINDQSVKFVADEATDNYFTYELYVRAGETYTVELSASAASFTLTAEKKAFEAEEETEEVAETEETELAEEEATEETEAIADTEEAVETEETEATDEQSATPAAEDEDAQEETEEETTEEVVPEEDINNEETDTEETVTEEIETEETEEETEAEETTEEETEETEINETETVEENAETEEETAETVEAETEENEAEIEENETETEETETEEPAEIINAWVVTDSSEYAIGDQITLYANADIELDNAIAWQFSVDGEEWHKAGYGQSLTVDLTEENANNFYRFKLADGTISDEYKLNAKAAAESEAETEEAEEVVTEEIAVEEIEEASEEETKVETVAEEETAEESTEEESETPEEETEGEEEEDVESETEEEIEEEIAEPLTDEEIAELGYRKVQILNADGTAVYAAISDDAAEIEHLSFETEIWIMDSEIDGWAEIYTEDAEAQKYVKLVEIEKQPLTDEQMLEMGYIKTYVAMDIGANIYSRLDAEEAVDHLDVGTELWVKLIDGADRAEIFGSEEEPVIGYISLVDIIATLKPDDVEELPTRELFVTTTLDELEYAYTGTLITINTETLNFNEDDVYEVSWQYSADGEEFVDIEDAHDLTYEYELSRENANYYWRVTVVLITVE